MLLKVISKERRHKTYSFMCVDFGKQWGKLKDLLLEQIKLISVVSVLILAPKSWLEYEMSRYNPLKSILHLHSQEWLSGISFKK